MSYSAEKLEQIKNKMKLQNILIEQQRSYNSILYKEIVEKSNIRLLVKEVLGYSIDRVHDGIIDFQDRNQDSLILAFRGAGKTTIGLCSRILLLLLQNPNLRILIASKTVDNAKLFLKEIKNHIEKNPKFIQIFGNLKGDIWHDDGITISTRTSTYKEPNILTVGVEGSVASRHFDYIFADDLIDENTCKTQLLRQRSLSWFNTSLMPTLLSTGHCNVIGTRYHPQDLYFHLMKSMFPPEQVYIFPALDENEISTSRVFSTDFLLNKKQQLGTIAFNSQYQCSVSAMEGQVFKFEWFQFENDYSIGFDKDKDKIVVGVDLAIGEKAEHSEFAYIVLKISEDGKFYVIKEFSGHKSFHEQSLLILELFKKYNPFVVGIESNNYQKAQLQEVARLSNYEMPLVAIYTNKNKLTRASQLSAFIESGKVVFANSIHKLPEQLLSCPDGKLDLMDALDLALRAAKMRLLIKRREEEPDLISNNRNSILKNSHIKRKIYGKR